MAGVFVVDEVVLSFKFDGASAAKHQLNFYEASRFMYGASRLISTLETFRHNGRVPQKITSRINADYRIPTPTAGSWGLEIIGPVLPQLADAFLKVPIDVMVAWAFEAVLPKKKLLAESVQLAEQATLQEQERTKQSEQETERMRLMALTTEQAFSVVKLALEHGGMGEATRQDLENRRDAIEAAQSREEAIEPYQRELQKIDQDARRKLVDKVSGQFIEIGKPLSRSAEKLYFSSGKIIRPFSFMDGRTIEKLSGREMDMVPSTLAGEIVRFDKETGWGKFRSAEFERPMSFVVRGGKSSGETVDLIEAMKKEEIIMVFYYVRDSQSIVKHLVFDSILDEEDEDFEY